MKEEWDGGQPSPVGMGRPRASSMPRARRLRRHAARDGGLAGAGAAAPDTPL